MDKKLLVFASSTIVTLVLLGMAGFYFFSPESKNPNAIAYSRIPSANTAQDVEHSTRTRNASGSASVAGICALYLVGYLFWVCCRKFLMDIQDERTAKENALNRISIETGRNEYDLFLKSAENWPISRHRIDEDFKRYMADQVMPHYTRDFVRKYRAHLDESNINESEVKSTSWSDWAIALSVFPGSVLLMIIVSIVLV